MPDLDSRPHDIVVFGATGFVGRLVAAHLAASAPTAARIALAGRSQARLEATRDGLGPTAAGWPLVTADSADPAAMRSLAASTRVVATTVGPYARYGLPLVEACAEAGTHYADLTGEVLFVRECIDRFHAAATDSGARIVNACGYDSIPSDLGVQMVHERAAADGAGPLGSVTLVARMKGGVSGGTIDSGRAQVAALAADPSRKRVVADPYALSPDRAGEPDPGDGPDSARPQREEGIGWTAPFVMGPFNTRIVRRSNALQGWAYGRSFRYREVMATGSGPTGAALAAALGAGQVAALAALAWGPTRAGLDRVLPKPGTGPSEAVRARGWFRMDIHATAGDRRYLGVVAGDGDPGYAATAVMFGQSALCLAFHEGLPDRAGVLTPATAMGPVLTERLRAAGIRAHVEVA